MGAGGSVTGPLTAGCGGHSTRGCRHGWRRTRRGRLDCGVACTRGVGQRGGIRLTQKWFVLKSWGSVGTARGPLPGKASPALVRHAGAVRAPGQQRGALRRRCPRRVQSSWARGTDDTLGESPGMSGTRALAPSSAGGAPGQGNLSPGADRELTLHLLLPCGLCLNERWARTARGAHAGRPEPSGADLEACLASPCMFISKDNLLGAEFCVREAAAAGPPLSLSLGGATLHPLEPERACRDPGTPGPRTFPASAQGCP